MLEMDVVIYLHETDGSDLETRLFGGGRTLTDMWIHQSVAQECCAINPWPYYGFVDKITPLLKDNNWCIPNINL